MPELSVVVPVYNEEENVEALCRALHDSLSSLGISYEVILVDDGSSDGTWDAARGRARPVPGPAPDPLPPQLRPDRGHERRLPSSRAAT